jgi:hypothetical protein
VLRLLRTNPFPAFAATLYPGQVIRISFHEPGWEKETGSWWKREEEGLYCPALSLGREWRDKGFCNRGLLNPAARRSALQPIYGGNISITRTLIYLASQIHRFGKGRTWITKGVIMSKAAFVILASGDNPESLGRVVNALMGAYEMMESGQEVKIVFDGAGT